MLKEEGAAFGEKSGGEAGEKAGEEEGERVGATEAERLGAEEGERIGREIGGEEVSCKTSQFYSFSKLTEINSKFCGSGPNFWQS